MLSRIPRSIIYEILSYSHVKNLASCRIVCKEFKNIITDEMLDKYFYKIQTPTDIYEKLQNGYSYFKIEFIQMPRKYNDISRCRHYTYKKGVDHIIEIYLRLANGNELSIYQYVKKGYCLRMYYMCERSKIYKYIENYDNSDVEGIIPCLSNNINIYYANRKGKYKYGRSTNYDN